MLLIDKMKKEFGLFSLLFVCILTLSVIVSGATFYADPLYDMENIYFKICADTQCQDTRVLFGLADSPVYIQAYDYGGAIFSGKITYPDGSVSDLDFNHLFTNDDYTKISLSQTGKYIGEVLAEKEGFIPFYSKFEIIVVNKMPERKDFPGETETTEEICESVTPLRIDYFKSKIISDSLNDSEKKDAVFSTVKEAIENSGFNDFVEGKYSASSEWQCPPLDVPEGVECGVVKNVRKLHSYVHSGEKVECSESEKGDFTLRGERILLGNRKDTMRDALSEAMDELKIRYENYQCPTGCTKTMDLGILDAQDTLFNLLGAKYTFGYELGCEQVENTDSFEFEVKIEGEQRCATISDNRNNVPDSEPDPVITSSCKTYIDCDDGFYCNNGECTEFIADTSCTFDFDCTLINKDWEFNCCYDNLCGGRDYSQDSWMAVNYPWFSEGRLSYCPANEACGQQEQCTQLPFFPIIHTAKCVEGICTKVQRYSTGPPLL